MHTTQSTNKFIAAIPIRALGEVVKRVQPAHVKARGVRHVEVHHALPGPGRQHVPVKTEPHPMLLAQRIRGVEHGKPVPAQNKMVSHAFARNGVENKVIAMEELDCDL